MKKILLIMVILAIAGFTIKTNAQCDPSAKLLRYTASSAGTQDIPNKVLLGPAPITIDGTSADWEAIIAGTFNYAGTNKGGYEPNPYLSSLSPGNVQIDGLKDVVGERDAVGQTHRDLRYFAFVYDTTNVYFFFRRPANNTAQVSLYYFIDMNADGFMKTGEPIAKLVFNNSSASVEMGYYVENVNSNSTVAAGSWVSGKGNSMVATVNRLGWSNGGSNNTSVWNIGLADGWNMPGDFQATVEPALANPVGGTPDKFDAKTLIDNHPDGTVTGYGVEFVIPWHYIRMYNAAGSLGNPLTFHDVFTYHVSLVGGNSGVSGAEDNAGGCCGGTAASSQADITAAGGTTTAGSKFSSNTYYKTIIPVHNNINATTTVFLQQVQLYRLKGIILPDSTYPGTVDPSAFIVKVSKCTAGGTIDGTTTITFGYDHATLDTFYYNNSPVSQDVSPLSDGYFAVELTMNVPGVKTFQERSLFTAEIKNTNTSQCGGQNIATSTSSSATILTPLPVKFNSFTAARNHSNVVLKWETAFEQNNKGFAVERNIRGVWEQVSFVASQAADGNSGSALAYLFVDLNDVNGITQYRLRQVDLDAKSAFSEIRAVRGEGQTGKTVVFPNPSLDGRVSVVFEDATVTRDASLSDMSGRILKQWKGITNNNIQIDNLTPGMYSLKIVVPATGVQSVEKIIVSKR